MKIMFLLLLLYVPLMTAFYSETDRVILRDWQEGDVEKLYEILKDPEVNKYLGSLGSCYKSVAGFVANAKRNNARNDYGYYVCENKETGEFMGFMGLESTHNLPNANVLMSMVVLGKNYWGQGYASEISVELKRLAFEKYNNVRYGAYIIAENTSSIKLATRMGLRYKRSCYTADGKRNRVLVYMMTREEYLAQVANEKC